MRAYLDVEPEELARDVVCLCEEAGVASSPGRCAVRAEVVRGEQGRNLAREAAEKEAKELHVVGRGPDREARGVDLVEARAACCPRGKAVGQRADEVA